MMLLPCSSVCAGVAALFSDRCRVVHNICALFEKQTSKRAGWHSVLALKAERERKIGHQL